METETTRWLCLPHGMANAVHLVPVGSEATGPDVFVKAAELDRLRALLHEAAEHIMTPGWVDGDCPICGAEEDEPHEPTCLIGRIDAAIGVTPNAK